jgi:outer membrane protein
MSQMIRRAVAVASVALALAAAPCGGRGALAQSTDAPPAAAPGGVPTGGVVLVVDLRRVMLDSKAGKAIQGQMQQQVGIWQKTFVQNEQDLGSQQQELQRQSTILAQDAFAAKRKEFEQKVLDYRKRTQDIQAELAKAEGQANDKLRHALQEILRDIAKEHGANFILDAPTVLLFDGRYEVTDEVMKRLDAKLPVVTVNFTTGAPAAPAAASNPAPAANGKPPAKQTPKKP